MGSKTCSRCGEQVDDAKAFCLGCGEAFVEEEKRTTVSEFDGSEKTVQLGQTMYNQLMSDMGLQKSRESVKIDPIVAETRADPAVNQPKPAATTKKPSYVIWLIIGGVVLLGLTLLIILAAIVILYRFAPSVA
jgi:predicted amidophosphoribosyltransferase